MIHVLNIQVSKSTIFQIGPVFHKRVFKQLQPISVFTKLYLEDLSRPGYQSVNVNHLSNYYFFQIRIPPHDHCVYETNDFEPDPPTQNGGLSPQFVNKLRTGGATQTSGDSCEQQFMRVLKKVYQTIERNEIRLQEQDRKDILKQEWQQLALVIDRLLLLVFILVTITVTLVVLIPQDYESEYGSSHGV